MGPVPKRLAALLRCMTMLILWTMPRKGQPSGHVKSRPVVWRCPEKLDERSDPMALEFQPQTAQTYSFQEGYYICTV